MWGHLIIVTDNDFEFDYRFDLLIDNLEYHLYPRQSILKKTLVLLEGDYYCKNLLLPKPVRRCFMDLSTTSTPYERMPPKSVE